MKLRHLYLFCFTFISAIWGRGVQAQEYPLVSDGYWEETIEEQARGGVHVDVQSGRLLPDGRLSHHATLEPGVWLSYRGFSGRVWADTRLDHTCLSQTDVNGLLNYSWMGDNWDYSCGLRYFSFPGLRHSRQTCSQAYSSSWIKCLERERYADVYIGVGWKGLLNPSLTLYSTIYRQQKFLGNHFCSDHKKIKEVRTDRGLCGLYGSLSLSHDCGVIYNIADCMPISLLVQANVNFRDRKCNKFLYGVNKAAFTDANVTVEFPIQCRKNLVLTPYVIGTALLDHSIRHHFSKEKQGMIYGVSLAATW